MSKTKLWSEMEFDELLESVSQHVHSELLTDGGKGIKRAVRDILTDIACNKGTYHFLKDRK